MSEGKTLKKRTWSIDFRMPGGIKHYEIELTVEELDNVIYGKLVKENKGYLSITTQVIN